MRRPMSTTRADYRKDITCPRVATNFILECSTLGDISRVSSAWREGIKQATILTSPLLKSREGRQLSAFTSQLTGNLQL